MTSPAPSLRAASAKARPSVSGWPERKTCMRQGVTPSQGPVAPTQWKTAVRTPLRVAATQRGSRRMSLASCATGTRDLVAGST